MSLRHTAQTSAAAIYLMIAGVFTMGMVAGQPEAPEWELRLKVEIMDASAEFTKDGQGKRVIAIEAFRSHELDREAAHIAVAEARAVLKEMRCHIQELKELKAAKSIMLVTPVRPAPAAKPAI